MKNRIRILATSDIHGCIYPYRYTDGSEAAYGLARMKTLVDLLRDDTTLLLDNGDVLQGSPLQTYHYQYHPDAVSPYTRAMNTMGYDYINLGNHDFDYGETALRTHLDALDAPCITGNVQANGKPAFANYVVREIGGKKVAVFGITTHYLKNLHSNRTLRPFRIKDAFLSARNTVETIRRLEKPDYIIALYHGGFERDPATGEATRELTGEDQAYQIAREIPGIDVLITGHTHIQGCGTLFGTVYAQPGQHGDSLACVDIYTDTGAVDARIIRNDAPADEAMENMVRAEEEECQVWLDTPIGHTSMDLTITDPFEARFHKSQVVTFINRIMMEASGSDLAGSSLVKDACGFRPTVTMRDLLATSKYADTLAVKKITGAQLRAYLEHSAEYWSVDGGHIIVNPRYRSPKERPYYYDMIDGVSYTIKVSNDPGQRIISLTRDGKEVCDTDEFTLCLCKYRANGGGNYGFLREIPNITEILTPMPELLLEKFHEEPVIAFEPVNNITVIL